MSHNGNTQIQKEDLDRLIIEKPKLSRSNSRMKSIIDAIDNNYYINDNDTNNTNNTNSKNTEYISKMYYNK
jgi:hypothetical protein